MSINNFYLFYKYKNITSYKFISLIKDFFNSDKIGYSGTLDPSATGVLVLFFDKNTKFISLFNDKKKRYIVFVVLSVINNTYDVDGKYLFYSKNYIFQIEKFLKIIYFLKIFSNNQQVPFYSSVKHNGSSLYKYARLDISILKVHKVKLYNIKLLIKKKNLIVLDVICSKGTYIRSIVNDIGLMLNIPLSVYKIIRVSVEGMSILDSYDLKSF